MPYEALGKKTIDALPNNLILDFGLEGLLGMVLETVQRPGVSCWSPGLLVNFVVQGDEMHLAGLLRCIDKPGRLDLSEMSKYTFCHPQKM